MKETAESIEGGFNMKKLEEEIRSVLEKALGENCRFPEAEWFLYELAWFFSEEHLKTARPRLIVLGEDFPQELALAFCPDCWFILGGSTQTTHWSDSLLPRDADPVSRSACGWLLNQEFHLAEKALVVMMLSSDNRKKLAGLFRRKGIKVAAADMPPQFQSAASQKAWTEEILRIAGQIQAHTGMKLTTQRLKAAIKEKAVVREAVSDFKTAVWENPSCMSPALRDIILESVWYTEDKKAWVSHLRELTRQIRSSSSLPMEEARCPWILLAGSPVIFPNEKLPLLLEASGLFPADRADAVMLQFYTSGSAMADRVEDLVSETAAKRLPWEVSGAWTNNNGLLKAIENRLERLPIDGIVYHVLKGQIEYDFELPKIERLASLYHIPLIRLETDYQQQDVEQLRIRLEAFSEMLRQAKQGSTPRKKPEILPKPSPERKRFEQ